MESGDYTYAEYGHNQSLINGVGRIGYMKGGSKAIWRDEDLADDFLREAKNFIRENKEMPFFLFYSAHQPHVPRLPNKRFAGKSSLGPRGDVIMELDWCVSEIMKELESQGVLEETIVMFSSDNGPVLNDGYLDYSVKKNGAHQPAGLLRGGKYSQFDGGARVPFIVSWKGVIEPNHSDVIVSQVDFLSSFAHLLGVTIEEGEALDSQNMMDVLLGKSISGRDEVLFESYGKAFALRRGKWEYLEPSDNPPIGRNTATELGHSNNKQLYNMHYDIGQKQDVYHNYMQIGDEMQERIARIVSKE